MRNNHARLLAASLAIIGGLLVFVLATELFPYHSSNHDEGVYLQQAGMLLDGRLWLTPGTEALREAVHPWFFIESERGLYPKYAPVPAAMFALGSLLGGSRLALGAIAAGIVGLVYVLGRLAFDARTGVLASGILLAAPGFLLPAAAFLPYAPTTLLNLLFAVCYSYGVRRKRVVYAGAAGMAVGLAFFARPYTAVLFALPFIGHAIWQLWAIEPRAGVWLRHGVTAGVGSVWVGLTLGYNALLTGNPLLFPYQAFAPLDGIGFGLRRILGHEILYTPELALRANTRVLQTLSLDWFTAGVVGIILAGVGSGLILLSTYHRGVPTDSDQYSRQLQLLLLSVGAVVIVGNIAFWGNLNIMGGLDDPDDGFIRLFGPFYHYDLFPILALLAASGTLRIWGVIRTRVRTATHPRRTTVLVAVLVAMSIATIGATEASVMAPPIERHSAQTEKLEIAYEPFTDTEITNGLVFLPATYGEWRNHPFQWLRNDPDFDGPAVYVLSRNPSDDFAVIDSYPNRTVYRYRYHGDWSADPEDQVIPRLDTLTRRTGTALRAQTTVAIPDRIERASVTIAVGERTNRYTVSGELPNRLSVNWSVSTHGATVDTAGLTPLSTGNRSAIPITDNQTVELLITITEPGGGTVTYRESVLVRPIHGKIEALWPPESTVCRLVTRCGMDGTYLPDRPETRPDGIYMNTTLIGSEDNT